MDWLMSEAGTIAFCVGVFALYIGFVMGLLINSYWVDKDDEDDGWDDPVVFDFPPDSWEFGKLADRTTWTYRDGREKRFKDAER